MFVLSVKSRKIKLYACVFAGVCAVLLLATAILSGSDKADSKSVWYNVSAKSAEERIAFAEQFGWNVEKTPVEIKNVVIPVEFNDVYKNYNDLQLSQGLDLTAFAGEQVSRFSYVITNYPGYPEGTDYIRLNILVHNGAVIGGDVCSVKLGGFMHGFEKE
ncbi:MAG: DUF4830 domain-containing protein [Ruminococcaceae bacterium]|nr:DUF4830 domain-containing protein [Oscillospiraceae bacterium]